MKREREGKNHEAAKSYVYIKGTERLPCDWTVLKEGKWNLER